MNKHSRRGSVGVMVLMLACIVAIFEAWLGGGWIESAWSKSASVSTTQVTVSSACSMTANVTSAHHATLIPGVYSGSYTTDGATPYANGIGSTTLTSFCNDSDGYAIYAIGYTGETDGVNTMVGDATGLTIATGTATSGNTSQWAMKLAKVTDSSTSYLPNNLTIVDGFGAFHAVPNAYTKVASYSSQTDSALGLGSKLTATYAVYVQPDQTVDTYVGKVKYTLVHPNTNDPSSFMVNFYANGGTGTMNSQKITRGQATALTSNSFTAPTGKTFNGWNTAPDGSGTSYADGEQVTNLADAGDTITLYAQWMENTQSSCKSSPYISTVASGITYMQDINSTNKTTVLSNLTEDATYQIKDSRDNNTYCVGKLRDGNLWLLDNLALDLTDPDVQTAMYSSTADDTYNTGTNAKNSTLIKLFNGGGTTSDQYPTAKLNNVAWTSDSQNYYSIPMMAKSGTCNNAYCVNDPTSGNWSYDSTTQATINGATSVYQGKIGIYYNYCAASAGSYCYGNGTSYTGTPTSDPDTSSLQDVKEDICPAGWRLPTTYNNGGEFANLYTSAPARPTVRAATVTSGPLRGSIPAVCATSTSILAMPVRPMAVIATTATLLGAYCRPSGK